MDLTTPGVVSVSVPSVRIGIPSAALSGHRVKIAELHLRERVPDSSFTRHDVVVSMDGGLMPTVGSNGGLPLLPPGTDVPVRPAQPNAAHIPLPVRIRPHRSGCRKERTADDAGVRERGNYACERESRRARERFV